MITTVESKDLIVKTNFSKEEISFEHLPFEEGNLGSVGKITFCSNYTQDGDGIITPLEMTGNFHGFEVSEIEVSDENGVVTDYPTEYIVNLISEVLEKSELN